MINNTTRFTSTVEHYTKYRPHYPAEILTLLQKECTLAADKIIADIGSGTGIFTQLLLGNGNKVFAVEPNAAIRSAAEQMLSADKNFHSVNGTAEQTTLPEQSVDMITSATAFHWFEREKAKVEFLRILKPHGWVVLLWNIRDINTPIIAAYEKLIEKFGHDYKKVASRNIQDKDVAAFLQPAIMKIKSFTNKQTLDWAGFQGRLLSTSYAPKADDAGYVEMIEAAQKIFATHQQNGVVDFMYETKVYYAQIRNENYCH